MEELDEFGIPIKKPSVDKFGIPLKKKTFLNQLVKKLQRFLLLR